ncbi:MAG: CDP-alcohol phosphatidyltransferase family protein [Deltaproteobacteria bacterium]|nr:CDP-alcohol phosphatidyltransferase family protein [Deltaproteobacteria bacterium]
MYLSFVFVLKRDSGRAVFAANRYLHPNAICIWRVLIGVIGMFLYFVLKQDFWGILLFTFSAVLDGVDGLVARECDLITSYGEELDPLCDKITYLPPMVFFAYQGLLDIAAVWVLVGIEICGQFLVRHLIKRFTAFSVQANNFGKIKAVLCFALIIYCAIPDDTTQLPDFTAQILHLCIILSIASSLFKIIPNRFYADILSILNLLCGVAGIILVFQGRFVFTALAILAGQIFDLFDGRMALKHGGTRAGPWLDDIADLVSFGICPGFLILKQGNLGPAPLFFGLLYACAVGFRLWRFLAKDKYDKTLPPGTFNGLPSPAGAMVTLGACLFWNTLWISWAVISLTSFLLVSHIRFVHFGRVILQRIPRSVMVLFGFMVVLLIAYLIKIKDPETLGGLLLVSFLLYLLMGTYKVARKII